MVSQHSITQRFVHPPDEIAACVVVGQALDRQVTEAVQELEQAGGNNYLCLEGNATDDNLREEAGIMHAKALVAALATDADNVYVTLSAK